MQEVRLQFERLSLPLKDEVYRAARALAGNESDALDLVQEAYLHAWRSFPTYREDQRFRAWLLAILRHAHVDSCRRRRVRPATSVENAEPEARAETGDLSEEMQTALERLKPAHHWLLLLRDVQGFTYAEIAGILDWPEGSVMSGLHHARAALRRRLKG
jgi:RNA polymerase sigma-70 factor (ECF subfamily)